MRPVALFFIIALVSCSKDYSIAHQIHKNIGEQNDITVCENSNEAVSNKKCYQIVAENSMVKAEFSNKESQQKKQPEVKKNKPAKKFVKKANRKSIKDICNSNGFFARKQK